MKTYTRRTLSSCANSSLPCAVENGQPPIFRSRIYIIIVGVNDCGKSSLTGVLRTEMHDLGRIIDVDKLTTGLDGDALAGGKLALRWSDVDLSGAMIHVRQSVEMVNGQPVIKPGGKTANALRDIPIPPQLVDFLTGLPGRAKPFSLVCQSAAGKPMSDMAFRRMRKSYQKELNFRYGTFTDRPLSKYDPAGVPMVIEPITAHMLRHTYATNLYLSGVDVYVAKELLGHADIKTTLNIYTHLSHESKNHSVEKYHDYLKSIC